MSEWQPIKTAPRDGTRMLVFCERVMGRVYTGRWAENTHEIDGGTAFDGSGWWLDGFDHIFNQAPFMPTHWMPLPGGPDGEKP